MNHAFESFLFLFHCNWFSLLSSMWMSFVNLSFVFGCSSLPFFYCIEWWWRCPIINVVVDSVLVEIRMFQSDCCLCHMLVFVFCLVVWRALLINVFVNSIVAEWVCGSRWWLFLLDRALSRTWFSCSLHSRSNRVWFFATCLLKFLVDLVRCCVSS